MRSIGPEVKTAIERFKDPLRLHTLDYKGFCERNPVGEYSIPVLPFLLETRRMIHVFKGSAADFVNLRYVDVLGRVKQLEQQHLKNSSRIETLDAIERFLVKHAAIGRTGAISS